MIETAISILGLGFNYVNSIQTKKNIGEIINVIEKNGIRIEKLSESIFYLADSISVSNTNISEQTLLNNYREVKEILQPIQQEIQKPLISSSIIESPQLMQRSIMNRSNEVFIDIQPLRYATEKPDSNLIPIIFKENNRFFVGWQMKGALPYLFNCKYDDLFFENLPISKVHQKKIELSDFYSIAGIKKGDNYKEIIRKYGQPTEIDKNKTLGILYIKPQYYLYKNLDLTFALEKWYGKIISMAIGSKFIQSQYFKDFSNDEKLSLLNTHKDSILEIFGKPSKIEDSILMYYVNEMTVGFLCHESHDFLCSKIIISWPY